METIRTATRIHPLMAAAAVSVVIVSLVGAAAITGILPSSHSETAPNAAALQPAAAPLAAMPPPVATPVAAPTAAAYVEPVQLAKEEAPVAKHTTHHAKTVHHHSTEVARNDGGEYAQRSAPQPAAQHQPNYVAIGAGALIGGVLGHQVGGGNGKKLATVAGAIGGGFLGNEVANRTGK